MNGPRRQAGASLLVVLIILVIMLLGGVAMLRSSEISALVAGNVAFKEAATQAADVGISAAAKTLGGIANVDADIPDSYYAVRQAENSDGVPNGVDWSRVAATTVGNDSVQYVIDRLCNATPVTDPAANCMVREEEAAGSQKAGALTYRKPATVYYRITVRVTGPKKSTSYVQALVLR